jgi:DNA-binding CsgD family transcriptional regulator
MVMESMVLSARQRDIARWWFDHYTIREIAEWLDVSKATVQREIAIIRAVYRSHGKDFPKFNLGRERLSPEFIGCI